MLEKVVGDVVVKAWTLDGNTVGGATSGMLDGRPSGVHAVPPGPTSMVIGLPEGPVVVVVMVDDSVENCERVIGTKVSVTTKVPTVVVTTVAPGGSGTLGPELKGGDEEDPGRYVGGGIFGTPDCGWKAVHAMPEGPTVTVTVLLWASTISVVMTAVTVEN